MPEVSEMADTETGECFDFVVIGAGMIGSSTAQYLSEKSRERNTNIKVAVIGVDSADDTNCLYGAWHDEGRITR